MVAEAGELGLPGPSPYVFVDEMGEPFHPVWITRLLHVFQKRIGLPEITLQDQRPRAVVPGRNFAVLREVVSHSGGLVAT